MNKRDATFKEGEDFYYNEQGLMVLTAAYHLKRGHCCHSDCLHCPFKENEKGDPSLPLELQMADSNSETWSSSIEEYLDYDPNEE